MSTVKISLEHVKTALRDAVKIEYVLAAPAAPVYKITTVGVNQATEIREFLESRANMKMGKDFTITISGILCVPSMPYREQMLWKFDHV